MSKEIGKITKTLSRSKHLLKGREGVKKIYKAINESTTATTSTGLMGDESHSSGSTTIVKTPSNLMSPEKSVLGELLSR